MGEESSDWKTRLSEGQDGVENFLGYCLVGDNDNSAAGAHCISIA